MKVDFIRFAAALGGLLFLSTTAAPAAEGQMLRGHLPGVLSSLQPSSRLPATNQLNLAIGLPLRNQAVLSNLLQDLYDPASPDYHRYLTPEQFTERFGPTEADYQVVIAFARANRLRITTEHPNRMLLDVSGSVADVERALHVTMRTYQHPAENRTFYAPDSEPSLDLNVPVLHIGGLDNYSLPKPRLKSVQRINGQNAAPNAGSGPNGAYMGHDFRSAYAPDSALTGSGQTVGLLQFDGYTASDITYYETKAGLPSVTLSNVLLDGFGGLPTGSGGEVEVSLDIEMSISMAPGLSKVIVYMAGPSGNWHDILNRMTTDNLAKQLSCSWYIPGGGADAVADQIFQQMAVQGQTFYSASGDYDAFTGLIPFPGDTPYITEVGGTTLTTPGPGGAWGSETVWNRGNGIGTGGGISTQYPIPAWQTNVSMAANQGSTTMRNVPDVALTAENVYVRADGVDQNVGGTSCAAPLWAGFTALVNQQAATVGRPPVGFINPAVYAIGAATNYSAVFHDTTTGNNTSSGSPAKFFAATGYDLCTGWGTPAGQKLIDALAPPVILILPASATEGDGLLPGAGRLQLPAAPASNVVATLSSSDPMQLTLPASVTVLAGQTNASFDLTILDDGILDGTQTATITALVPGAGAASGSVRIFDKETATLQVLLPATVTKGQGAVGGTVQVSAPVGANVTVALASDTTNLIQTPASVVIPTGQNSVAFTAIVLTDGKINGGQTVNVTAHVQNWTDGVAAVAVQDNVGLAVALPASAWENAGVLVNAGSVSLAGTSVVDEAITLVSGNPSKLIVPATVTILAGSLSNTFNVTPVDDALVEGHQTITVTASAPGFTNGSASMLVLDKETPPFPFNPRPTNLAVNVPANTNLTWRNTTNAAELVLNGGFETGTFSNWLKTNSTAAGDWLINNGTYLPPGPGGPTAPFAGGFGALSEQTGPGIHTLYQDVTIPNGASSATLSWADLIRNFGGQFSSSQYFHTEIRGTNNALLQVVFTTNPGDPLTNTWTARSFDLAPYIGQTIRIAFVETDNLGYFNVGLDNVSVQVGAPATNILGVITNDVYFGTNPAPGPAEFLGSTTNSSWTLPLLSPLTTYYWQVVAHRVGTAAGPVWQFTTAGVDHFTWSSIPSPQLVNQPFTATITALDYFNNVVTNFNGSASLSAAGGGTGTGTVLGNPVSPSPANNGTFTIGYSFTPNTNLIVTYLRSYSGTKVSLWTDAGVLLTNQIVNSVPGTWVETPLAAPLQLNAGSTYRVGFYTAGTTYYERLDGTNTFAYGTLNQSYEIPGDGFPTTTDNARWWLVDLRYSVGTTVALPVSPPVSGAFSNGAWNGSLTVQQPGTNVVLRADDGNGHTGTSNPFGVGLTNDLSLGLAASPSPVSAGAALTYTLTVANTGPAGATGVTLTNVLPAAATFLSVTSSQGTCAQSGGLVTASLGVIPGGTNATVTLVVLPTTAGTTLTNTASVSRAEADGYLGNNTATVTTLVTVPAISIADASCVEGGVGLTNMLFTVTLAAPSAQTITVNYATADGTAVAGRDYLGTNGTVTFPAGVTNQSLAVAVMGSIVVGPAKTFLVNLSAPVNGTLGRSQAVGTILNTNGLPGQVDHFVWNTIPTPQFANMPFTTTVTALDYFNNAATNFNGSASLSAAGGGTGTGTVLGNPVSPSPANNGTFTIGYSFTPNTNLIVTYVRSYSGTKVSLWTDAGVLLTNQIVNSVPGTWVETPLAAPLQLNAGSTYRVGFYTAGTTYYERLDGTNTFAYGTLNQSYEIPGDGFPTTTDNARWWLVDLRYSVGTTVALPVSPPVSGAFSNGAWNGSLTVQQPGTNVVLRADDGNGHTGTSNPFGVGLTNDLSLGLAASPSPVSAGAALTYTLTVANTGPAGATGVTLTNVLPAAATFLSVTSSQGTCAQSGGLVTASLGVIPGGTNATVTLVVLPTTAGTTLTNTASVSRAEADGYLGNNTATVTTLVTVPAISIADASCVEGGVGLTNMLFTVTLAAPSAQTITVNYATADGTAVAGRDYLGTNGTVTFPAGVTNQSLAVAVMGSIVVGPAKTFLVNLSAPVNGTLGRSQAVGTILNTNGLPGQVDHFVWNTIPTPQFANMPFTTTVTALDYFNNVVSNFSGKVNFSAGSSLPGLSAGSVVPYFTDNNPSATGPAAPITQAGFTPLQVTDISALNLTNYRVLFIDEEDNSVVSSALSARLAGITAWVTNGGCLIVHDRSAGDLSPNPFLLGTTGIATVRSPTADVDVIPPGTNLVVAGPFGAINNTNLDGGTSSAHGYVGQNQLPASAVPILSMGGNPGQVVAFSYPLGPGQVYYSTIPLDYYLEVGGGGGSGIAPVLQHIYTPNVLSYISNLSTSATLTPLTPTNSGNFANGVWSGSLTVQQPGTNVVLRADDGNGHTGASGGFNVIVATPPVIQTQPASQNVVGGSNVTFNVTATSTMPMSYFWQENGSPLPGATNSSLTLSNLVRTNSGSYNVIITNFAGSTNSSNAVLTVHVPQLLGVPLRLPDGTLKLTAGDFGGGTVTAGDLANLKAQASSNLVDWIDLPGALTLTNGTLRLQDAGLTNSPVRFYRIIESW